MEFAREYIAYIQKQKDNIKNKAYSAHIRGD